MTRAERDAWVEALRSGKYKQGVGQLRDGEDGFCCLGVYCDLQNPEEWATDKYCNWRHRGCVQYAPHYFSTIDADMLAATVAEMNDRGKPFAEIADWIEANMPVED